MSSKKKNTSLIDQFCAVTGASKDAAKQLLEACNNNLEVAVNMHMEGAGPSGGATADVDAVRAPIPQTQEILVDDAPAYAAYSRRKRKTRSVFDGFRDFQEEARQQEEELMSGASGSRTRKTRTLQDLFRPPVDLTYKGTFNNAREAGKTQGRWLMVNIQNIQEFACQTLNRDVWSNSAVKALVKEHFIFWQVHHDSEEGQRYCQFYKMNNWPYVAVLDPQTGENLVSWNKIEPLTFCDLVMEFLRQHPAMDSLSPTAEPPAKRSKTDDILEADEDDQLQAAIKASLTEVKRPSAASQNNLECEDSDVGEGEDSELETFTDSEEESRPSPVRTRRRSQSNSPVPKSKTHARQRSKSPNVRRSPRRNSEGEGLTGKCSDKSASPNVKKARNQSPLATSSETGEECKRTQRRCSPKRTGNGSPVPQSTQSSVQSPRKRSPMRNSSQGNSSPLKQAAKSVSVHNDVHPAVLDNIRRQSVSEDDEVQNVSNATESVSSEVESDKSVDCIPVDSRDYKTYLGPESDDKVTMMLRFPDGQRDKLSIAFSSKLMAVVLYVGTKGFSNERYELIAQYPRRELSTLDYDASLKKLGLHAQETIFVQARH